MASSINASTAGAGGVITTADNSGVLQVQTAGTTALTIDASQNISGKNFTPTSSTVPTNGVYLPATNAVGIATNTTNAVYIDSSQNVGIGTTSPGTKLHVNQTNDALPALQLQHGDGDFILMEESGGTDLFKFSRVASSNDLQISNVTANSIRFATNDTERMRLNSDGNFVVGGTTAGARITATSSANDLYAGYNGATQKFAVSNGGTIYAVSTSISSISDIRYKENIRNLDVGLEKILELKPRLYDWKKGKGLDIKNARGFIAQEFEQVFPDLIDEWKDLAPEGEEPYKSVRQDLMPVLVKAIQELNAKVDAQAAEIAALKAGK